MSLSAVLEQFHVVASNPKQQLDKYLKDGQKVVLTVPVYTPEEIIHAMGLVPMGAWGADVPLDKAKEYFPAFLCSIVQSVLELGMQGAYEGVSAIVIPSLCDTLKCLGQNWKYGVPSIPFVPMTYPQNRFGENGRKFTRAGYERVISDLEKATGAKCDAKALQASIAVYNEHNAVMRELASVLVDYSQITCAQRSDIYKSAFFMKKEEHTELVKQLLSALSQEEKQSGKTKIVTTGILCDSPALLQIFDENKFQIVADDVAAETRQYRTDTPVSNDPLQALTEKFEQMNLCSVLYDPTKARPAFIAKTAKDNGAKGVVVVLTKFCDPEEFDYPLIKKACEAASVPVTMIEVDRQMVNYEQARTSLEAFSEIIA